MDEIIKRINQNRACIYSVTEIKDGTQVNIAVRNSSACHNSYSVAKVFTMTAIGMLVDDKDLRLDQNIYDLLAPYFPEVFDEKWKAVTVHNVLTHKMGIEKPVFDIDTEDIRTYGTGDFLKYILSEKLTGKTGETYVYSDAAYYILSRVVSRITGKTLCDFLMERLFVPLEFQEVAWSVCPSGYSIGATGLYIRTCDMAKLGDVYLNDGIYNARRIVSEKWVRTALENQYEFKLLSKENQSYYKGGMYCQMLYFSKKYREVISWHAFDTDNSVEKILSEVFDIG